ATAPKPRMTTTPPLPPVDRPFPPDWSEAASFRAPPPTGLLTFVAVINLLFGLGCGCFGGASVAVPLNAIVASDVSTDSPEVRAEVRKQLEENLGKSLRDRSEEERRRILDAAENLSLRVLGDFREDPGARRLAVLSAVMAGACAGFAVGAVLLLARLRVGRWLSILSAVAFLAAATLSAGAASDVIERATDWVQAYASDPAVTPDLSEAERETFTGDFVEVMQKVGPATAVTVTIFACIWPLISLLILVGSQSIRDAVSPQRLDRLR
ncbi:MAG TPA: hypothetical protein VEI02_02970, partial [Planctomycetota bacterium]|nr:hypothetical protein [Planctomycetota bacterium]